MKVPYKPLYIFLLYVIFGVGQTILPQKVYAEEKVDSLLLVLDQYLKNKPKYDEKRLQEIAVFSLYHLPPAQK